MAASVVGLILPQIEGLTMTPGRGHSDPVSPMTRNSRIIVTRRPGMRTRRIEVRAKKVPWRPAYSSCSRNAPSGFDMPHRARIAVENSTAGSANSAGRVCSRSSSFFDGQRHDDQDHQDPADGQPVRELLTLLLGEGHDRWARDLTARG